MDDSARIPARAMLCAFALACLPVACFSEESDQGDDDDDATGSPTSADSGNTSPTTTSPTTTLGDSSDATTVSTTGLDSSGDPTSDTRSTDESTTTDDPTTDSTTGTTDPLCPDDGDEACEDGIAVPGEICLDQTHLTRTSDEQHDRVVIADINGDALPDAIVGDGSVGYVFYENDGAAGFTATQGPPMLAWSIDARSLADDEPARVLVGGFDSDTLLLGDDNGELQVERTFTDPGGGAVVARFVDFDGLYGPDVVTASSEALADQIHVYLADGDGGFADVPIEIDIDAGGVPTIEDLRGIEDPEHAEAAIVMLVTDGRLLLRRQSGVSVVDDVNTFPVLGRPALVAGDLDGDALDDVVVASSGRAYLYEYDTLDQSVTLDEILGDNVDTRVSAAIGDIDRNGRADVVLVEYPSNTMFTYLRGNAGFASGPEIALGALSQPIGVTIGLVNDDCAADLLVFNSTGLRTLLSNP